MVKKRPKIAQSHAPRLDRFDPFLGDASMRAAYRFLVEGNWGELEEFFDTSPISWLFGHTVTSQAMGIETVTFERWATARSHPQAQTMYAAALIRDVFDEIDESVKQAGSHNDETLLSQVAPDVLPHLQERLKNAELTLLEVVAEWPTLIDPWVYLLMSGRGLGIKLTELRTRFDNAYSRGEFRPDACYEYLQSLTAKWGGSQKAVFTFARWVQSEAPADSPARRCLPVAHIEEGLLGDKNHGLATYLQQQHVLDELFVAAADFLRSIPDPGDIAQLSALNAYGLVLHPHDSSSAEIVEDVFNRIASRPTAFPWVLFREEIIEVFHEIQTEQRRSAARFSDRSFTPKGRI